MLIERVKEVFDGDDIIENGRLITVELTRSFGKSFPLFIYKLLIFYC